MSGRALAALAGTLVVLLWTGEWPAGVVALTAALALLCFCSRRLVLCVALAAACWTAHHVGDHRTRRVTEDVRVIAEVVPETVPAFTGSGRAFDARARLVRLPRQPEIRVRVAWNRSAPADLRPGDVWQLALQLRASPAVFNPGAVDGTRILWRDHIHARAEVIDSPLNHRLSTARGGLQSHREHIARFLLDRIADPAAGALLAALAVGYTAEVAREHWQAYNATGITHLIAISGMHVTLFAVIAMALLRGLWGITPSLAKRVRRETFVAVGGVACAFGYALLAGYSVPSQRTALMLAAGLGWRMAARASSPSCAPGAALLAVLLFDPFAVLAAGFWLSFGAVAVILWREATRLRPMRGWVDGLRLQVAITVALAPATIASFGSVSLVGLLVNPAAIPLFSLVLVPLVLGVAALLLAGAPDGLAALPLWFAEPIATWTVAWLARISQWPGGLWQAMPPAGWYGPALLACLVLVLPFGLRVRCLLAPALLALFAEPERLGEGAWRALELDAGAAPLVLVETRAHALAFGTGDRFGTAGGRIATLLLPAAREQGIDRLDLLMAGRLDRDVAAGIGAAQALIDIGRTAAAPGSLGELPPGVADCREAGSWVWDGVPFTVEAGRRGCTLSIGTGSSSLRLGGGPVARPGPRGAVLHEGGGGRMRQERLEPPFGTWRRSEARTRAQVP